MIIQFAGTTKGWGNYVINGTTTGWGEYVLNGTQKKPRDHSKIKVLKGDIEFGDRISNTTNYKYNAYAILLGFKGMPDTSIMKSALEDFERMFMHGFSKDEYHLDAVLHQDTDDYHIHIRIPKLNIKTGTQLQLYMDSQDRKRVNLIRDFIDIKYDLESPLNNRKLVKEEKSSNIEYWREQHRQKTFDFSKPKERRQSELDITNYIRELHQAEFLNSLDDVKNVLKEAGLSVDNVGHDFAKDFHYITVSNESGKIRLKGDLYNAEFWEHSREDRTKQISTNQQFRDTYNRSQSEYERIQAELKKELVKRHTAVTKRYQSARARADEKLEQLQQKNKQKSSRKRSALEEQRTELGKTHQNINSNNATNLDTSKLSNIQTKSIEYMAHTEAIPTTAKERKIYSYTRERIELYKKQAKDIHKNRRLNVKRNARNTTEQGAGTRTERTGFNESLNTEGESLYNKTREFMQKNRDTRTYRERYRETIDKIGTRCESIREQYSSFIKSAYGFIKNVKEFIEKRELEALKENKVDKSIEHNQSPRMHR